MLNSHFTTAKCSIRMYLTIAMNCSPLSQREMISSVVANHLTSKFMNLRMKRVIDCLLEIKVYMEKKAQERQKEFQA